MANEQNLRPGEYVFTLEDAKKGQINSAKARRERRTIQNILKDYLANEVQSVKGLEKVAAAAGITGEKSIKELLAAVCILNTLKKGDVDKLDSVAKLLGEDVVTDDGVATVTINLTNTSGKPDGSM